MEHRASGPRGMRAIAFLLTAALHAGLAMWLLKRPAGRTPASPALQVVWIVPAPASAPVPPSPGRDPAVSATSRSLPGAPPPIGRPPATAADASRPSSGGPGPSPPAGPPPRAENIDRVTLARQARAWARDAAPAAGFRPDPLRRPAGTGADGPFAMRDPPSAADVVRSIGTLLGGADYTTDPCPRIRHNIAALGSGGDAGLLDEELRRLRRLCL